MLTLNVTREEFETRILQVIENFNGNPIAKKGKRLSLINQSLKTLLHGNSTSKNNEHNLDQFFSNESTEKSYTYTLAENYHHSHARGDDVYSTTTYHESRQDAEMQLYKTIITNFANSMAYFASDYDSRIQSIVSYLTDAEIATLKSKLEYSDFSEVRSNEYNSQTFGDEILALNNIIAIRKLSEMLIDSEDVSGFHAISRIEYNKPKAKTIDSISIVAITKEGENPHFVETDINGQTKQKDIIKNYFSSTDINGQIKQFLLDTVFTSFEEARGIKVPSSSNPMDMLNDFIAENLTENKGKVSFYKTHTDEEIHKIITDERIAIIDYIATLEEISPTVRAEISKTRTKPLEIFLDVAASKIPLDILISNNFINKVKGKIKPKVTVAYELKSEEISE